MNIKSLEEKFSSKSVKEQFLCLFLEDTLLLLEQANQHNFAVVELMTFQFYKKMYDYKDTFTNKNREIKTETKTDWNTYVKLNNEEILRHINKAKTDKKNKAFSLEIIDYNDYLENLENEKKYRKFLVLLKKYQPIKGIQWRKGLDASSKILKVIAIFGGQWPHTSYAIPGGVVSDPTTFDITEAISIVDSLIDFYEKNVIGMSYEKYFSINSIDEYLDISKNSDLKTFLLTCLKHNLHTVGKSYHRFLTVCDINPSISKGITKRKRKDFDINKVKEVDSYSYLTEKGKVFDKRRYSWAKAVRYEGLPYETSPLSRRINNKDQLFINLLKEYKDSYMVRTWARIDEIIKLLVSIKKRLNEINIKEPSYIKPEKDIKQIEGKAFGFCEAARGSLIHQLEVKEGKIKKYNIITPSTWNLGPRCEKYLSPAEKAIKGLKSQLLAEMVLRSFDVCSVCTTH